MIKYPFPSILSFFILVATSYSGYSQSSKPRTRINHTAIFVTDLKVTKAFYENIVGLDTIPEPFHDGKHAWYSLGAGVAMHVIQGASEKKSYYKNQHTCFSVASVESFAAVLKKNNISFEDVTGKKNSISSRVDGVKQIWLQDPDGYWLEINDAKE
jgi:lactoylglutathione lyase